MMFHQMEVLTLANKGLVGFVNYKEESQLLSRMHETLKHRSKHMETHTFGDLQVGLLSDDQKTFSWQNEHSFITYCGSFYSHTEDKFKECCEQYDGESLDAFQKLNGSYILLIHTRQRTLLVRDAAGERSLFYTIKNGYLYFAIEAKALLNIPGFSAQISEAGIAQYLACSYLPTHRSIIKGIRKIKPGHYLEFKNHEARQKPHYRISINPEDTKLNPDRVEELRDLFDKCIQDRLTNQAKDFGVFLSGGLDSTIVAAALKNQGHSLRTWTIHFGEKYNNELSFAEEAVRALKSDHENFKVEPKNFIPDMHKIIWALDEPIGDPITIPNYQLARHASKDVSFIFNGEGGDPLFGGPKNFPLMMKEWYGAQTQTGYSREKAYLSSYKRAYNEIDKVLLPHIQEKIHHSRDLEAMFSPFFLAESSYFLNKLMAINTQLKGAQLILPKVERMLGANGITPLAPLFDRRMIDFAFKLYPKHKLAKGNEKIILKQAFQGKIPQSIIDRPKSGMRVPVHFWFQEEMKKFANKILAPKAIKQAGIFDPNRIKELMSYNTPQWQTRYGLKLWMILTFEIWRRVTIEGENI